MLLVGPGVPARGWSPIHVAVEGSMDQQQEKATPKQELSREDLWVRFNALGRQLERRGH